MQEKNNFISYLIKNDYSNKIFILGFIVAIAGYSFWKPIRDAFFLSEEACYQIHFICVSLSFFFYTLAYLLSKYDKWRWFPLFVTMVCLSRVLQEIFYPTLSQEYEWLEYFNFALNVGIVLFYYIKYKRKKFDNERRGLERSKGNS